MVKISLVILSFMFYSGSTFARDFTCEGKYKGNTVVITGHFPGITSLSKSTSRVIINDREIARFHEGDMDVSLFSGNFEAKNNHGDEMNGELISMGSKKGIIHRIYSKAFDIDYQKVTINCR